MQLLDTDLTQNEVKTDSEVGSLFLKPNKLGATVEKEASTTFALCVEEPLRYFSVWAVPPGTAEMIICLQEHFNLLKCPMKILSLLF